MRWFRLLILVYGCVLLEPAPLFAKTVRVPESFAVSVESAGYIEAGAVEIGDTLSFRVSKNHNYRGCTVFAMGAPVIVVVRASSNPSALGKPSVLHLEVLRTKTSDDKAVALKGFIDARGQARDAEALGTAAAICCLGVFVPGGRRDVDAGIGTLAFTTEAVDVECSH